MVEKMPKGTSNLSMSCALHGAVGVTGWWQGKGRSDKPMHLNAEKDIFYIKNYSFWLDLKIILRTPWVLLRHEGAY